MLNVFECFTFLETSIRIFIHIENIFLAVFQYPNNELFQLLNSRLDGEIILGMYANTRKLDYSKLKEIIVIHEIGKDRIFWK